MTAITRLMSSRRAIAIVVLNAILAIYSIAVADFVRSSSTSVVTNMYLILGWVALVGIVSYLEASVIRDLVSRGGWRGSADFRDAGMSQPRPWRDLHLPLTIAILALFVINMFLFDQLSGRFFIDGQRATYAITRMRSDDEVLQREGILTAARMKDPRIRRALEEQLAHRSSTRPLAAWAMGKVGTSQETGPLVQMLENGTVDDRAAAAVALGRLRFEGLIAALEPRMRRPGEPLESYLYGLGLLGDRRALESVVSVIHDESTAPDHLAMSAWVLGQLGDRSACLVLRDLVEPVANPLTCAALYSIERLRCDHLADTLIPAFEASEAEDRCDSQQYVDLDGQSYELWSGGLFRVELLHCLVRSRSSEVQAWLRHLSHDSGQPPEIRAIARRSAEEQRRGVRNRERGQRREP